MPGGRLLRDLADRFGTPLFVYDAALIRARIDRVRAECAYRPLKLLFSAKANPAVGIARLMHEHGLGFDACSPGDLRLAELAGVPRSAISYTGFGADAAELAEAASAAADLVVDSREELHRLAALGVCRPIGLRVNPGITAGFHAHVEAGAPEAKFGIAARDVPDVAVAAVGLGLPVVGLHAHLGSDVLDASAHVELIGLLAELAANLDGIEWVNLGGGWGTPRRAGAALFPWRIVADAAERHLALAHGRRLELRIEPGGHLIMDAGVLLGRVIALKAGDGSRPDTIVTDAGTNHLVSVLLYDADHAVRVASETGRAAARRSYRVAGNLMQAGDVLADAVELPEVNEGDVLAFSHAGAYAACRATTFNERPRAAEVLADGADALLLRRAETLDELFARDVIPGGNRPGQG